VYTPVKNYRPEIPPELARELAAEAVKRGVTATSIVVEALDRHLRPRRGSGEATKLRRELQVFLGHVICNQSRYEACLADFGCALDSVKTGNDLVTCDAIDALRAQLAAAEAECRRRCEDFLIPYGIICYGKAPSLCDDGKDEP